MNLLLLSPNDIIDANRAIVNGRQLKHLQEVLQATNGRQIKIGLINGKIGTATVKSISTSQAELIFQTELAPPPPSPVSLILCMPRPKVFKRTLQTCATLGVKQIILLNSYRVDKSYWQSKWLEPEPIDEQLQLGLEQAVDTALPRVTLEKRFKPFVEDRLPAILKNQQGIVAHPYGYQLTQLNHQPTQPTVLVIGPEGGFIPYEVEKLCAAGCKTTSFGDRILKVEQAISYCIAKLSP